MELIIICVTFSITTIILSLVLRDTQKKLERHENFTKDWASEFKQRFNGRLEEMEKQLATLTNAVRELCPHEQIEYDIQQGAVNGYEYKYIIKTCAICSKQLAKGYTCTLDGLNLYIEYLETKKDSDTKEIENLKEQLSDWSLK